MPKPYSAKILDIKPRKHPLPIPPIILAYSTTSDLESLITLHGINDTPANCCIYCCHAQHTKFKEAITTNNLSPNHNKQLNNSAMCNLVSIIVKGCASYKCWIHIIQQSNELGDRMLLVVLGGWLFIWLTINIHYIKTCKIWGYILNYFPTGGYLLNELTKFSVRIR
jgi:hypothetical protein